LIYPLWTSPQVALPGSSDLITQALEAQQAREAELVAFVEEIGDGLKLRDDRASEILYRIEQGWSDRKLARLVERLFHGQPHDRRTEVAERVIAFAREQSVPGTSLPKP
jgi:hypothetical protein